MATQEEYICINCKSFVEIPGKPKKNFLGFEKLVCPKCKKPFQYPLDIFYKGFYWLLLLGNVALLIYMISKGSFSIFGINPIGLAVLIYVGFGLKKNYSLVKKINQVGEEITNS